MFEKLVKTTWSSAGRQSFKAGKEQPGCLLASAVEAAARKSNLIFAQHSGSKKVIPTVKFGENYRKLDIVLSANDGRVEIHSDTFS